jgi:3-hydroxyisobutyrate dehydrogenase-like beta-hydroxyacid dehydrogenase
MEWSQGAGSLHVRKIGFIGVGKIGFPICEHLIKKGYTVVGYRRSSLDDFKKLGGIVAQSAAEVGAQAEIVFTCLPNDQALDEVVRGGGGLLESARTGQIVVEFGSHPVHIKQQYVALFGAKQVVFLDGEISGTPGMVAQRKGVVYLGGPTEAVTKIEPVVAAFAESCLHLGNFGAATKVKLVNNFLVALHIAGTAQAMALGLSTGIDKDLLITAVATGSGGSTQFGIRAPWMAERRFMPQQGSAAGLAHYLDTAKDLANRAGVATDVLDCLISIFARAVPSIGERDVAAMLEYFEPNGRIRKERPA